MSKFEKLLAKLLSLSKDMRFDEIKKILENYGFVLRQPKSGSSHNIFNGPNGIQICIPKANPIKLCYVVQVKKIVEELINDDIK